MITNSFNWAAANGKVRTSPVHGEQEARLVLEDWFEGATEKGDSRTLSGTADLEAEDPQKKDIVIYLA